VFNIIIKEDYRQISEAANEIVRELLAKKQDAIFGLATGSTPLGLYSAMIADNEQNITDYQKVVTFNLDEYIGLPDKHPQSYKSFMEENLFSKINIKLGNTHLPLARDSQDLRACQDYEELLADYVIDIQVLGIGANGHIGFNEPGTAFDSFTHIVELAKRTRLDNQRFFSSLDEVPTHAITMGIATIMKAKKIILLASGENKAQAVFEMINGPIVEEMPASILQKHPNVIVLLDKAAASKL